MPIGEHSAKKIKFSPLHFLVWTFLKFALLEVKIVKIGFL